MSEHEPWNHLKNVVVNAVLLVQNSKIIIFLWGQGKTADPDNWAAGVSDTFLIDKLLESTAD